MKPQRKLAEAATPDGGRLTLHEHDGHHVIRCNGQELMHSAAAASERLLGELAVARLARTGPARILIGGLGLGFTLRSVLDAVRADAAVQVVELMPAVVEWNRTFLRDRNGALLDDPRVTVAVEDVNRALQRAEHAPCDAILLDVDNGPTAMVQKGNARLYDAAGIARVARALKPGGRLVVWSAGEDRAYAGRLAKAGFRVEAVPAKLHAAAKRATYTIYVADRVNEV